MAIFVAYPSGEIEVLEPEGNRWRSWWGEYIHTRDLAHFIRRRSQEGCEVVLAHSVTRRSKDVEELSA
jgi:hypothetical protein